MSQRVSLADIARKVNVSSATVSYVLNGRENQMISEGTRERVLAAARELGYRPNRAAQMLAGRGSNLIEMCVYGFYPSFYGRALHEFEQQIGPTPYQLHIVNPNSWSEDDWEGAAGDWPVAGIIIFDAYLPGQVIETLKQRGVPIVSTGINPGRDLDHVHIDVVPALLEAARHLAARGKRVAFLSYRTPEQLAANSDPRYHAYRQGMQEFNKSEEIIVTPECDVTVTRAAVRESVREYVEQNGCPDAIMCFNDERAIGTLAALRDLKLRVPEDVLLIGCDGIEDTIYQSPPLSTIQYPLAETARLSWEILHRRLKNPATPLQSAKLTAELILRESSERAVL